MKWKAVLAVLLVLGIFGLFLTTDYGRGMFGNFFTGIFSGNFGDLTGSLTGIFQPKPTGSGFEVVVTTTKDAFSGQKYKVSGATVATDGIYNFLKVGDQVYESKSGKRLAITVKGFSGDVEFTAAGSMTITGTGNYFVLGDLISSSDKQMSVQIEIVPNTVEVDNFGQRSLHFASISGRLDRYVGEKYDSVTLSNSRLDIGYFNGTLSFSDDGTVKLSGIAFSAKGDTFSFV